MALSKTYIITVQIGTCLMDPLALVVASGGRVHNAQGKEVREGAVALAQTGCQKLNEALKKSRIVDDSHI